MLCLQAVCLSKLSGNIVTYDVAAIRLWTLKKQIRSYRPNADQSGLQFVCLSALDELDSLLLWMAPKKKKVAGGMLMLIGFDLTPLQEVNRTIIFPSGCHLPNNEYTDKAVHISCGQIFRVFAAVGFRIDRYFALPERHLIFNLDFADHDKICKVFHVEVISTQGMESVRAADPYCTRRKERPKLVELHATQSFSLAEQQTQVCV